MEPVGHALGVRAPFMHARVDPACAVAGDDPDGGAPLRRVNCRKNRSNTSLPYPSYARIDPVSLVVDSHGDVRVTLPVAGLVHANRRETVERQRHSGPGPAGDPAGDVARGAPCDMRETTHGLLAGHRHQARALHLEIPSEPAAGLRPRHRRDDHAAHGAVDARYHGDQPHPPAAEILAPPTAHAAAPWIGNGVLDCF